ncbi:MAG: shikimate dehydrogenase [Acidocella sp. 20-57-95]|nr:MAG: shikimate dehydrogenase [Acidocella sp. 20-57-95]
MITGNTKIIIHTGFPTETFKSPMIYNPWFEKNGIDAVVVPMAVEAADYPTILRPWFKAKNVVGALVTMPHKVTTTKLVDELSITARVAGSCNAVLRRTDGSLYGDMFDGEGFTRGLKNKGQVITGKKALVVGNGGVGSAIAASLAADGVAVLALYDGMAASSEALAARLREHYPQIEVLTGSNDPAGYDIIVNATPMGMKAGDPLPFDIDRLSPASFVGEVVMKEEYTALLRAALAKGCRVQVGTDMLFEQIPAYLEFFGFGATTPAELRLTAKL